MKRSKVRQHGKRQREFRGLAIMASLFLHGAFAFGIMATTWFWGRSGFERVSAYTVSLVDAPLSLTQPPAAVAPPPPSPPPVEPPEARDEAPATAPKPSTDKQKVEEAAVPEPPATAPEPPPTPKDRKTETAAKPEPRPPKKEDQTKPKVAPRPPKSEPVAAKPKPPSPDKPAVATSKEAQSAVARLRQQQGRQQEEQQQAALAQKRAAAERIEGLREQLTQTANVGDQKDTTAALYRVRFAAYQERVRTSIIQAWVLPLPPEQTQALQATVLFRVRRDGRVDGLDLVRSSGNALFDASLVRAIHRASPLPELPADYPKDLLEVEMRFSAREPSAG